MDIKQTVTLLILGYLSHVIMGTEDNFTHSIYSTYGQLRQDIMERTAAKHRIPPGLSSGIHVPYPVNFSIVIINVHKIDEIHQVVTLQVYISIEWRQKELSWNPYNYNNISAIEIDSSAVWTPKYMVCMGLDGSFDLTIDGELSLTSEGWLSFIKLQYITFACDIDFHRYPFDHQICKVGFYPQAPSIPNFTISDLNFTLSKVYNRSGEWMFSKVETELVEFAEYGYSLYVPFYIVTVQRKSLYYVIMIICPMVMTSLMIPLVFLIPAQTGEKVSYLVSIFTSTAVFLNFISEVMPRSLSDLPYLAMLLTGVLIEGFLAILCTLMVLNAYLQEWKKSESSASTKSFTMLDDIPKQKPNPAKDDRNVKNRQHTLSSSILDKLFFFAFIFGQVVFLSVLFVGTGWVIEKD